jgi:hypothetical protein
MQNSYKMTDAAIGRSENQISGLPDNPSPVAATAAPDPASSPFIYRRQGEAG